MKKLRRKCSGARRTSILSEPLAALRFERLGKRFGVALLVKFCSCQGNIAPPTADVGFRTLVLRRPCASHPFDAAGLTLSLLRAPPDQRAQPAALNAVTHKICAREDQQQRFRQSTTSSDGLVHLGFFTSLSERYFSKLGLFMSRGRSSDVPSPRSVLRPFVTSSTSSTLRGAAKGFLQYSAYDLSFAMNRVEPISTSDWR